MISIAAIKQAAQKDKEEAMYSRKCSTAMLVALSWWALANPAQLAMADTGQTSDATKADEAKMQDAAATKDAASDKRPYLGVVIEPLHPAMASHLPDVLIKGQGVLVSYVTPDSPAAKAGIKQDDILVQLDDQKLFSAEQLTKLILADKQNSKVKIKLVRKGELQTVQAKLGERDANNETSNWWQREFGFPWSGRRHTVRKPDSSASQAADPSAKQAANQGDAPRVNRKSRNWKTFDSLSLEQTDKGKFHAEIKYLDKDGKLQQRAFDGSPDEIQSKIKSESDLPQDERKQLLNAIASPQQVMVVPNFGWAPADDLELYWLPIQQDF